MAGSKVYALFGSRDYGISSPIIDLLSFGEIDYWANKIGCNMTNNKDHKIIPKYLNAFELMLAIPFIMIGSCPCRIPFGLIVFFWLF